VSSRQKETSSTTGMRESVETSALINYRAQEVVPKRIKEMEDAIRNRDFPSFARLTCSDSNQFHAVCLDTSPPIFYMNDTSHRIISYIEKWNHYEGAPQVAYTFDAGPNAVIISPNRKTATQLLQRLLYYFPASDPDLNRYVIGDETILKDAGISTLQDVEALAPPPETKGNSNHPIGRSRGGDISYFVATRPGRGPVVVTDGTRSLVDPQTGLPK
ncbi:hypothetical protein M569_16208, partial [Genlisea aurea]